MRTILSNSNIKKHPAALKIVEDVLLETATTPLLIPSSKTDIVRRAAGVGYKRQDGLVIADYVLSKMRARAVKAKAKLRRQQIAEEDRKEQRRAAVEAAFDSLATQHGVARISLAQLRYALRAQKVRLAPQELAQAREALLVTQLTGAFKRVVAAFTFGYTSVVFSDRGDYQENRHRVFGVYRGDKNKFPAITVESRLSIRRDFYARVCDSVGATAPYLLVLDAEYAGRKGAVKLYRAVWVARQWDDLRKKGAVRHEGIIAIRGIDRAFGATVDEALARLPQ